ncbi:MAG: hypothetical protein WCF57_03700 [Pyrinomonadaceae bacterium]
MSNTTRLLAKLDRLSEFLPQLISSISQMENAEIIQTAISARYAEQFAFLVCGACALELRQRVKVRLAGGRGKRDNTGKGIRAQMRILAREIGVNEKTLAIDARIKDIFFREVDQTTLEHMPSLAREYYAIALAAPDPQSAIEIAQERCSDPHYKLEDFRAHVRGLKRGEMGNNLEILTQTSSILRVALSIDAQNVLSELIEITGKRKEDVLTEALLALHKTYSKDLSVNSKRKTASRRTEQKKAKATDADQLSLGL